MFPFSICNPLIFQGPDSRIVTMLAFGMVLAAPVL